MKTSLSHARFGAALLLGAAGSAHADTLTEAPAAPAPRYYSTVFAGTTLAWRASGERFAGPSRDVSPMVGVGYLLTDTVALELDLGPTFLPEGYGSFSLVPGVVWSFNPYVYAAARALVSVDPARSVIFSPGVGATYAFSNGLAPFVELSALGHPKKGGPDLGAGVSAGVSYYF